MNDIFRQIAKENGTTEKAVKEEMQFAIREAMKSAEPEAVAFGKQLHRTEKNRRLKRSLR